MAEVQQFGDDEELNIASDENGSPDVSTTDEDEGGDSADKQKNDDSSKKGEENKESLTLEEEGEKTASTLAEQKKKEQENAWFGKIVSGQKTLDDLPKHQQWLKPELEKRLNAHNKAHEVAKEYDIDAIVGQKISEIEDSKAFKALESQLSDMSLTSQQIADLKAEFKDFRQAGLPRTKSLEKAIKICGINMETDMRRKYMAPPKAGDRDHEKDISDIRQKYQKGDPRRVKALAQQAQQYGQD